MIPRKRICCADEACSFGKVCTNPLLRTVCSASNPEMDSDTRKKKQDNTQAVAGMNSQIRISESSDSEQHDESDREARRVTHRPGKPGKETTPEEEVADTIAYQSFLIPSKFSFFGTRNSYFIASPSYKTRHTVLDLPASTHREVLDCWSAAAFR